ncbi:MAG: thiamine phosphate synthase [Candidatus Hydrogenedentes bacterium]|nr:thiamine phosphate synthase [Candidatus Hydrogenedentota bacterium]
MTHAERMHRFAQADLYVVITEAFCAGRRAIDVLDAVLDAGVTLVQFREKDFEAGELYVRATAFRERTKARALLIIDDRIDIALAVGADGVHLGQNDLPILAARAIGQELIIGASSHSLDEALSAQDAGASYVNIGPIFSTQTKRVSSGVVGPELIDTIRPHLRIPFTTMGGIKLHNISEVVRRGARHVAVVTAVTEAVDPRAAATALRDAIGLAR